ncbi:TPA: lactoylglutathione lyase [Burkholderia stabilis]|nr:lactoylglutathione lyase [Burkholderia stabilis]HDR9647257.1 lactoylglutathione lyase [Burkholderia stabilis]HDR9655605.1 lactoylglutathione lyase [Burkholderia stabilis]HDR9676933.1 lactoylglutathione lyase [Burkholderia stabilis]
MRVLHTMLRVSDLNASLQFYHDALGMRVLRQQEYPDGRFTLAFVGYRDEREEAAIELTYNWDRHAYEHGDGYGHVAIEVDDAADVTRLAKALGYRVTREAGPMQHGRTVIAFLEDPDGYKIELIQKGTQFD